LENGVHLRGLLPQRAAPPLLSSSGLQCDGLIDGLWEPESPR
jgi:hypothetical protein